MEYNFTLTFTWIVANVDAFTSTSASGVRGKWRNQEVGGVNSLQHDDRAEVFESNLVGQCICRWILICKSTVISHPTIDWKISIQLWANTPCCHRGQKCGGVCPAPSLNYAWILPLLVVNLFGMLPSLCTSRLLGVCSLCFRLIESCVTKNTFMWYAIL